LSPIKRLLRRVPALRYLVMRDARDVRNRRQEAAWKETQGVLIALGNITIGWAGINIILNHFLEQYQIGEGAKRRDEIPRNFTGKLKYMKEIESDPLMAPHVLMEWRAVRLKLGELNEFRINLTHGLLVRKGYGGRWTIHIAKEVKDRLQRWNVSHTTQEIHDFAKEISDMGGRIARLMPHG